MGYHSNANKPTTELYLSSFTLVNLPAFFHTFLLFFSLTLSSSITLFYPSFLSSLPYVSFTLFYLLIGILIRPNTSVLFI